MTSTADRAPVLRIEIRGNTVVARAPDSGQECLIAENCDDNLWNKVNGIVWHQLNRIRAECATDPALSEEAGRQTLFKIYRAGMSALLVLVGSEDARRLGAIREFCSPRLLAPTRGGALPPIIDVVSERGRHIPLEILPLIGVVDPAAAKRQDALPDLARVLPGLSCVIRHVVIFRPESAATHRAIAGAISLNLFRHNGLAGVHKEIRSLREIEGAGGLSVSLVFPPKGHQPAAEWPEYELAQIVAGAAPPSRPDAVCHFSCHLLRDDPGPFLEMRPDGWRPSSARYLLEDLRAASAHLTPGGMSVAFLNTCRSGVDDPLLRTSAVEVLRYFNPQCIVGTLADAPDVMAAEFSAEFYRHFAAGSSVGAALLTARRALLFGALHNPFGLLYTSYFGEDVHRQISRPLTERIPDEADALRSLPTA
jgi:hypothetical protein